MELLHADSPSRVHLPPTASPGLTRRVAAVSRATPRKGEEGGDDQQQRVFEFSDIEEVGIRPVDGIHGQDTGVTRKSSGPGWLMQSELSAFAEKVACGGAVATACGKAEGDMTERRGQIQYVVCVSGWAFTLPTSPGL